MLTLGAVAARPQLLAGRDWAWELIWQPLRKWLREFAGCAGRAALLHGKQGAGSRKTQEMHIPSSQSDNAEPTRPYLMLLSRELKSGTEKSSGKGVVSPEPTT